MTVWMALCERWRTAGSTLEESFASYEAGMRLVRACSEKIDKVEKQIMVVNGEETEA